MAGSNMFRAIVVGGASLVGTATLGVICDACGSGETAGPVCVTTLSFFSPCGFQSITTTCSGNATCDPATSDCEVGPLEANCSVSVVLGDGTSHTFPVTVGPEPGCGGANVITSTTPSFNSTTCHTPTPTFDASPDADASDASDASDSSALEASVDATDGD